MLLYQGTSKEFVIETTKNEIVDRLEESFKRQMGYGPSVAERRSWQNSLRAMALVVGMSGLKNHGVGIEYQLPGSSKRLDFMISGLSVDKKKEAVIIELKQWSKIKSTEKDAVVITALGGRERETAHPSYQAWSYADLLTNFNRSVEENQIQLAPCAFLHNCEDRTALTLPFYQTHINKAPIFFKRDVRALADFIKRFVKYGDTQNIMEMIDNGEIRPSKALADSVVGLLNGKQEVTLIDDQKIVFETALQLVDRAITERKKQVFIVGIKMSCFR
jgi:hypothetical protein